MTFLNAENMFLVQIFFDRLVYASGVRITSWDAILIAASAWNQLFILIHNGLSQVYESMIIVTLTAVDPGFPEKKSGKSKIVVDIIFKIV